MPDIIFYIFNTREVSIIFWITGLSIWLLTKSEVRQSLLGLVGSIFVMRKFFLFHFIYIGLSILFLFYMGFWNDDLLKITIYWIIGSSIVSFVNSPRIHRDKNYLKKTLKEMAGLAVAITFIVNLYPFPLPVELLLVPFAFTIIGMTVVAEMKEELKQVHKFLSFIQIILGLVILLFSLYQALANFKTFSSYTTLQEFFLPIILSIMLLPFLYGMSLYGEYEQKKIREKFINKKNVSPQA